MERVISIQARVDRPFSLSLSLRGWQGTAGGHAQCPMHNTSLI